MSETVGLDEVAAWLGRDPAWLRRHWLSYHDRHGFPRRIPGAWVWPRRAVEAWLRAGGMARIGRPHGEPVEPPANQNLPGQPVLAAFAAALDQRYGVSP